MRVHIQIDDGGDRPSPERAASSANDVEIIDAGGPPAELLRSLGVDLREAAAPTEADAVDAGAAPDV
jgi:hypothetical protein